MTLSEHYVSLEDNGTSNHYRVFHLDQQAVFRFLSPLAEDALDRRVLCLLLASGISLLAMPQDRGAMCLLLRLLLVHGCRTLGEGGPLLRSRLHKCMSPSAEAAMRHGAASVVGHVTVTCTAASLSPPQASATAEMPLEAASCRRGIVTGVPAGMPADPGVEVVGMGVGVLSCAVLTPMEARPPDLDQSRAALKRVGEQGDLPCEREAEAASSRTAAAAGVSGRTPEGCREPGVPWPCRCRTGKSPLALF